MYDFSIWGVLATDSWIKALWEKIHAFHIDINMDYKTIEQPRINDVCLMHRLVADGIRGKQRAAFNRVRKHQEAIFLSCITNANGKPIDRDFLTDWRNNMTGSIGSHCSGFIFGSERHPTRNWVVISK